MIEPVFHSSNEHSTVKKVSQIIWMGWQSCLRLWQLTQSALKWALSEMCLSYGTLTLFSVVVNLTNLQKIRLGSGHFYYYFGIWMYHRSGKCVCEMHVLCETCKIMVSSKSCVSNWKHRLVITENICSIRNKFCYPQNSFQIRHS